ncbi:sugar ABC transporter permease [Capillimicrobium parvum]|uniref:Xylose transport system permease protein XylH n=1 Tax=Capillimicrobium parvum TaxID=2884022 RepID=A0A9E6Y075_9ACTN|nr:sugar ABC transporter permease [Capillimicrobium parvum]UGS37639.1 Xylose transport system permease protein XylH [Capillimicrobium parvum]
MSTSTPTVEAEAMPRSPREFLARFTQGEFGSLRVLITLAVIWIIFAIANDRFLTAINLTNLTLQIAGIGLISVGVVLVLLLGEIDLSVGIVSGLCAAIMAVLNVKHGWPAVPAIAAGLVAGILIGAFQGFVHTRFGIPSFVVTLAGLLGWQGVLLWVLGDTGTINLTAPLIVDLAGTFFSDVVGWIIAVALIVAYAAIALSGRIGRVRAGLEAPPVGAIVFRIVLVAVPVLVTVWIVNQDRGLPLALVILVGFVIAFDYLTRRTRFGRHIYAVGGNEEAARRAGINTAAVRTVVFSLASLMAACGGIMLASRLLAVNQSSGGSDLLLLAIAGPVIAGTSLFGGRGTVWSALLGALVIGSISNGMDLLALSSDVKFMVTGAVLLLAVIVDSLTSSRRRRAGRV